MADNTPTVRERLELLLDAVEYGSVSPALMFADVIDGFQKTDLPSSGQLIHLGLDEQRSQIEAGVARSALEYASRLRELINEIRRELQR